MKPFDFYALAGWLLEHRKDPAGLRTVISRAYYAVFLHAEMFLAGLGVELKGDSKHKDLVRILAHTGDSDLDALGSQIADLRAARNDADYDLDNKDVEKEDQATLAFQDAGDVMLGLDNCRKDQVRLTAVTAGIQARVKLLREGTPPPSS